MQKELFKKVRPSPSHIPAIPLTHPCHSPHALKGQKLLAQGIRPGYSCPHAWRPVGAKALYGDRTSGFASQSILELAMGFYHMCLNIPFWYIR